MPAPLVLVSCDRRDALPGPPGGARVRPRRAEVFVKEPLVTAVTRAGGVPLLLPPLPLAPDALGRVLDAVQAVVVSGGAFDIHPSLYGQQVVARLDRVEAGRTTVELALCRAALARGLPLLGLCGGMQAMVVASGGTLVQDIATDMPGALDHEQQTDPATPDHEVLFEAGRLRDLLGERIAVNSTHHQAVAGPGAYRITGRAPDGVPEAIEAPGDRFALGVQWHPELLDDGRLFTALVEAALVEAARTAY